ncbi:MAG: hypothetical protein N6V41_01685, partial [Candidatus Portiera aleyrodidarum]|nr:hypothetical protein [Candidatus Portiera aleyrodidarum]
ANGPQFGGNTIDTESVFRDELSTEIVGSETTTTTTQQQQQQQQQPTPATRSKGKFNRHSAT